MNHGSEYLVGVVLCGGESRRMGRDKGLIVREGMSWAERMGRKLLPWALPVAYSIRAEQEETYSAALPGVCLVTDAMDLRGPLNGLSSVHGQFPGADLLLLGCDMQDVDEATIGDLIRAYRSEGGAECYIYRDGQYVQPLCGIYTARGLERVLGGTGKDRSLRGLIGRMRARDLEIRRPEAFANYNSIL